MTIRHLLLAIGVALSLAFQALNSFNGAVSAEVDAARLISIVTGPGYARSDAAQRDNILVVVFSDQDVTTLSEQDNNWRLRTLGPSYADQASLILAASEAGAAAIFVDITYSRRVESAQTAAALARAARMSEAPVFFGPIADTAPLGAAGADLEQAAVSWTASRPDKYPLVGDGDSHTAALRLYRAICADPQRVRVAPTCAPGLLDPERSLHGAEMVLTFGRGSPEEVFVNWDPASVRHCPRSESFVAAFADLARMFTLELFSALTPEAAVTPWGRCHFHPSMPGAPAVLAANDAQTFENLKTQMQGRVVMIAAALSGSSDFAEAPGIGVLPGVFHHAMALDNLLTFGDGYKRKPPKIIGELDWGDLAELALALLGAWAMSALLTWGPWTSFGARAARIAGAVLVPLGVAGVFCVVAYTALDWAGGDLLGAAATAIVAFAIARKEPWERLTSGRARWPLLLATLAVLGALAALLAILLTWAISAG